MMKIVAFNRCERASGIELLRIIMMLQVIFLHVCLFGKYQQIAHNLGGKHELLFWFIRLMCSCPVYVYLAVQGYFGLTQDIVLEDSLKKAGKTHRIMLCYSIGIVVCAGIMKMSLTPEIIGKAIFPVMSRTWYFMTNYLIVLILSPFINKSLNHASKKDYSILLIFLFLLFSIWPILANLEFTSKIFSQDKVINSEGGLSLYGFLYMYVMGGYLRLYTKKKDRPQFLYLILFVLLSGIHVYIRYRWTTTYGNLIYRNDNPIFVIQVVLLILFFRDLKFKSKVINYMATANIGVYIIHEHFLMRKVIWNKFSPTNQLSFYESKLYPIKILVVCIMIYLLCMVVELIRQQVFKLASELKNKLADT